MNHVPARMRLSLPVHPHDSTKQALPYLEAAFAHYVAQWERLMPPDPDERDARGFFVEATELPSRIADPAAAAQLSNIATSQTTTQTRRAFSEWSPCRLSFGARTGGKATSPSSVSRWLSSGLTGGTQSRNGVSRLASGHIPAVVFKSDVSYVSHMTFDVSMTPNSGRRGSVLSVMRGRAGVNHSTNDPSNSYHGLPPPLVSSLRQRDAL